MGGYLAKIKDLKKLDQNGLVLVESPEDCVLSVESVISPCPCTCDPLPSQKEYGHLAQAGCGPTYERCDACGYRWRCKLCLGCRRCRES